MKYETSPAEKSTVKVTITFTPEEWAAANNQAYYENKGKYAVNGFRKGKVPKHVLELYYGKSLFYEDALGILYSQHYPAILEKEKDNFTAVGDPELSVDDLTGEKVVLVATVPVLPDVKIASYKGIKIRRYEYTVTDAEVEKDIDGTRERLAEKVEVTDRPAANGDTVKIDFLGKADGVAFDGGSATGYDLTLGSGSFIPGFEDQVVGMKIGETKDLNVTFPEDYQAENLKGKPAVFTVTLHAITGKKLPEANDELAKKMGSDSIEAYRKKVRERLEKNAASRSRNETENSILTEIAKGAEAEIPDVMVERQEDYSMRNMEYNLMYQGIKLDDYLKYMGTTREEYKKNFEAEARRTVLHQLILEKVIKLENITASKEELDEKIAEQAKSIGKDPAEYQKTMEARQIEYIESDIKVTKAFDFLMANNDMYVEGEAPKAKKPAKKAEPKEEASEAAEPKKAPAKKATKKEAPSEEKPAAEKPKKAPAKKKEN